MFKVPNRARLEDVFRNPQNLGVEAAWEFFGHGFGPPAGSGRKRQGRDPAKKRPPSPHAFL